MVDLRGALRSPFPNKFGFDFCRFALGLQGSICYQRLSRELQIILPLTRKFSDRPRIYCRERFILPERFLGLSRLFRPRAFLRLISGVLPRLRVFSRPLRHRGCMGRNFACFGVIFSGLYNKVVKPSILTVNLSFNSGVDLCLILRG